MTTKKEALARKNAWTQALAEGRVVRYNNRMQFQSFATVEKTETALRELLAAGFADAEILCVAATEGN